MKKTTNNNALVKGAVAGVVSIAMIFGGQALENAVQIPSKGSAKPAMADAEGTLTTGTYTASENGFGGPVNVTLTVGEKGGIADVALEGAGETPEIGGAALETLKEQILAAQGSEIDGVAGASLTSGAVKSAVAVAIAEAGGPAVEAPVEEAAEEETPAEEATEGETPAEETPAEETPVEEAAEEAPAAGLTAGTYTGKGTGFGGDVVVTITVGEDGTITDAELTAEAETPEIGGKALDTLKEQILAAQSAEIDGVAGASLTSAGAKEAVAEALKAAAGGAEETEAADDAAPATLNAGTYTVSDMGFGGDVVVTITVDENGVVTDAKVEGESETPEIGGKALDTLAEQIVAAQSAEIDGVAGASLTSGAAKSAAAGAFAQAAGTAEETGAADGNLFAAGTYEGTSKGFGGDIVATVTVDENAITDIQVVGDKETANIGSFAVEMLPGRMMDAQTVKVDSLTGATVSSNAIKSAVSQALKAAGCDLNNLPFAERVEIATEDKAAETLECDIVIVGAGGAGMTAAINATQAGKNVILVEKMPYIGGNTTKASGGMNAAGTKKQEAAAEAEEDADKKAAIEDSTVENYIADTMKGGHDINDIELVTTMAENSSDAVDWLESIGAPLPLIAATGGTVHYYLHEPEDGSAVGEFLVKSYREVLDELGVQLMLETKATEILTADGKACGVTAEGYDTVYTINADAVILATGGFGANFDMLSSFDPSLANAVTTNTPAATGDGIVLAQAMGADTVDLEQIQLHPTVYQASGLLVSERLRSNGAILVNKEGKRFTNDLATRDAVSQAELQQTDGTAYIVYDAKYAEEKLYQKYVTNGITVSADTVEELGAALGFDEEGVANFAAAVEDWNKVCAGEQEDEFGRNNGLVSLDEAPYTAIMIAPGIHHTMGGVKINTSAEVIDTEGNVIPGLFAAGEVTGGVHGGNRIGGNAVADIVVFGRVASDSAVAYCDNK